LARIGKKLTDSSPPAGIVIIQATESGFELKMSENLNYDQVKHLLIEALHIVGFYEENSCIPDNQLLQ
jgi:hypothetical protein